MESTKSLKAANAPRPCPLIRGPRGRVPLFAGRHFSLKTAESESPNTRACAVHRVPQLSIRVKPTTPITYQKDFNDDSKGYCNNISLVLHALFKTWFKRPIIN